MSTTPSTKDGQIFNGHTFSRSYSSDLAMAKRSIVISSPKLNRVERNVMVYLLSELAHRGLEVLILTTMSNEQTAYLMLRGLSVKIRPDLSLCTTIIDKNIVWYGAINVLGYTSEEENMIKVTDKNLATDLIEVLFDYDFA